MSSSAVAARSERPSPRQVETINRLVDAAVDEIRTVGFAGLTVRNVAARAGVAAATAYTYFDSKEHLVSEVFWRRLKELPLPQSNDDRPAAQRVADALRSVSNLVADEPELSAAVTTALLAHDPQVKRLRDRIGANIRIRLTNSLGADDLLVVHSLELLYAGALLQAGTGHLSYDELGDRLIESATLILGGRT
ncbi:MAG: TetR family transcriptional regulator [Microthrixaceae bacterium]|nr:TetR family transcriptional regulator [Microthrixaceae bacterium]MCO5313158.1 TetR family transcriptional regulator [Microthrixaceae bacterium]HPB45774.1 TetR family transcriptional regulator [Microthrixaceae bacterium]